MNEELLNAKLNDDTINVVLDYLKDNVKDYDMSNIKYEVDENGNFKIKFDDKEITLPNDYTVGDSLYTINSALNISDPVIPKSLLLPEKANNNNNNYNKRSSDNYNIAIDLDLYSEIMGILGDYKTEEGDVGNNNNSEDSVLGGELLSYYNANFSGSYMSNYKDIVSEVSELSSKVEMSVMYYLSIDESLANNMDNIMDSIFSEDFEISQMMYDMNCNTDNITYEEYVELLHSSDEYFAEQKCQYLSQFMLKIDGLIYEYRFEQMPKLLNQMIETFANYKAGTESAIDFKNRISEQYFELYGYPETEGDNSILNTIPSEYWYGTSDNPTSRYDQFLLCANPNRLAHLLVKDYCNGDNKKVVDLKGIIPQRMIMDYYGNDYFRDFQYHESMLEPFEVEIKNSLFGNIEGINEYINCYEKNNSLKNNFLNKIRDENGNFDYSRISYEEITKLCNDYFGLFNTSRVSLNDLKDLCSSFDINLVSNLNDHFLKSTYPSDTVNKSIASAFCDYYNITDEQTKKEIIESNNNPDALSNVLRKILIDDGVDGATSFLSKYYSYLNQNEFDRIMKLPPCPTAFPPGVKVPDGYIGQYCNTTPIPNINVNEEEIKNYLLSGDVQNLTNDLINRSYKKSNLYASLSQMIGEFRNNLNYINNSEETSYIYFAKKLDTSSVTDEMVEKAKRQLRENGVLDGDLKYIEDWQLKSYALILSKDNSEDSTAWKFCDGFNKKPRSIFVNQIIQGRAFDEAKAQVSTMTAGEYIWATIVGFGIGTIEGVGNFISGIGDVVWADGEVSQSEYRQQFVKQLLTTDYSLYQQYRDKNPDILDKFSSDYSNEYIFQLNANDFTNEEVNELVNYAKENNIPKFELEYMLGIIDETEYTKYKSLYQMKDNTEEINYYARLQDKKWLTGYTDVVYSVGQGVGNMLIPVTLSILSAYCPALSYLSIGLTSLSTVGKTRESLMQQGVTDQAIIWGNALLHGLIEGAGEAIFGGVINTKWGANAYKYLEKIPGLGKVLNFTDDLIGKIDYLSFGGEAFKRFLKNDLKEVLEELGENVWGYLVDGTMGLGWPTGQEIMQESWQTIWQTALTTPILNAFSGVANNNLRKTIKLANGLTISLTLSELNSCRDANGNIDSNALFELLQKNDAIKGNFSMNQASDRINRLLGLNIVRDVVFEDGKQYIILSNDQKVEFDSNSKNDIFQKIFAASPTILSSIINNSNIDVENIDFNDLYRNADHSTIISSLVKLKSKDIVELCSGLDDENFIKVFDCVSKLSLSTDLLNMYKNRILKNVDVDHEIDLLIDRAIAQETSSSNLKLLQYLKGVDWGDFVISKNMLDHYINNNNYDNFVNDLFKTLDNNMIFCDQNLNSFNNSWNNYIDLLSLAGPNYLIEHMCLVLNYKEKADFTHLTFTNKLYNFKFDFNNLGYDFQNQLMDLLRDTSGNVNYLELTKLICGSSPEAYRTFNKHYATEYITDYLSKDSNINPENRDVLIELFRNNPNFSSSEVQSFIHDGKFDIINFLEYGLTNFRLLKNVNAIDNLDFIKELKRLDEFGLAIKLRGMTDKVMDHMNNLNTQEEVNAYLSDPGSDFQLLSFVATYLARDANLRVDLKNTFYDVANFLKNNKTRLIESGNHQVLDINGIKVTLYGSDEYINSTKLQLEELISSAPEPYLALLAKVDFKLYDYENPGNLLSLLNYYLGNSNEFEFRSGGSFNRFAYTLHLWKDFEKGFFYHELGHALDKELAKANGYFSQDYYSDYHWKAIIDADNQINGGKYLTSYTESNPDKPYEDFADFSMMFGTTFIEYCKQHPERSFDENYEAFDGTIPLDYQGRSTIIGRDYPNRFKEFKKLMKDYYAKNRR